VKTPLLNQSKVKAFTLAMAKERAHKFTRVSGEFFMRCEAQLKNYIRSEVRRLPSKGKTIQ